MEVPPSRTALVVHNLVHNGLYTRRISQVTVTPKEVRILIIASVKPRTLVALPAGTGVVVRG